MADTPLAPPGEPLGPGQNLRINFHVFNDALMCEWWWHPKWAPPSIPLVPYPMCARVVTPFN